MPVNEIVCWGFNLEFNDGVYRQIAVPVDSARILKAWLLERGYKWSKVEPAPVDAQRPPDEEEKP